MRKAIGTAVICAVIYMVSFGLAAAVAGRSGREGGTTAPAAEPYVRQIADTGPRYVIKEHNGVVAVFLKGGSVPTAETDIPVDGLRARDREQLILGMEAASYTEVLHLLEDLNS